MKQEKLNEEMTLMMGIIHKVLSAGDDILKAEELLSNAVETLVNYASDTPSIQYQEHILIVDTLIQAIKELQNITRIDKTVLSEKQIEILDN